MIERVPGTRFLVAGSGTHEEELHRQAEELGLMEHGTFLGWIGDDVLHSLYRIADLTVVPSIYEPFGLVALGGDGLAAVPASSPTPAACARSSPTRRPACASAPTTPTPSPRSRSASSPTLELGRRLVAEAYEHLRRFDWADVAEQTAAVYAELVGQAESRLIASPALVPWPAQRAESGWLSVDRLGGGWSRPPGSGSTGSGQRSCAGACASGSPGRGRRRRRRWRGRPWSPPSWCR